MNINRNNYEELYLLYVDGELSAPERQAVEQFMKENPDTAHELIMLQQTKLDTEQIVFSHKDALYKSADELSFQDFEERSLLYVDDELNDAEKKDTELFVLQHPQLQEGFTLLKQTKLRPETIPFPAKASLYRKEEKPVAYFSWTRLAIAAAMIGFAVLVWTLIPFNNGSKNETVATKNSTVDPINDNTDLKNPEVNQIIQSPDRSSVALKNNIEKKMRAVDPNGIIKASQAEKNIIAVNSGADIKNASKETIAENAVAQTQSTISSSNTEMTNTIDKQLSNNNRSMVEPEEKNIAHQTVYKELDTEQDERRNNIYIGNMEVNKDKLVGFFKRASHVFSRSKDEDGKVAIANFSVDTKSLK